MQWKDPLVKCLTLHQHTGNFVMGSPEKETSSGSYTIATTNYLINKTYLLNNYVHALPYKASFHTPSNLHD